MRNASRTRKQGGNRLANTCSRAADLCHALETGSSRYVESTSQEHECREMYRSGSKKPTKCMHRSCTDVCALRPWMCMAVRKRDCSDSYGFGSRGLLRFLSMFLSLFPGWRRARCIILFLLRPFNFLFSRQ